MRLLIIEDDLDLQNFLKESFITECLAVDAASDGEAGSFLARTNDYDVVILDYNLPKKMGSQVCREIRAAGKHMPIIMLSVEGEIDRKLILFDLGADDYVTKPFSYAELKARVRAVLRRPKIVQPDIIKIDTLSLDAKRHLVFCGKKELRLTRKEFILLEFLMRHCDEVMSRATIMEHVWDINADPFSNTIEAHIMTLRKKIEFGKKFIHTVPGRGYKFSVKG